MNNMGWRGSLSLLSNPPDLLYLIIYVVTKSGIGEGGILCRLAENQLMSKTKPRFG